MVSRAPKQEKHAGQKNQHECGSGQLVADGCIGAGPEETRPDGQEDEEDPPGGEV